MTPEAELTIWQKTWPTLLGLTLCMPMIYVWNNFGLEALFLGLSAGVLLVVVGGVAYFVALKEGIEAGVRAVGEVLGGAVLFVLFFAFVGMVAWEIVVSVWRHFPQGW